VAVGGTSASEVGRKGGGCADLQAIGPPPLVAGARVCPMLWDGEMRVSRQSQSARLAQTTKFSEATRLLEP